MAGWVEVKITPFFLQFYHNIYLFFLGASVILIPEIPWDIDAVITHINEAVENKTKQRFSIVVVAEGLHVPKEGKTEVSGILKPSFFSSIFSK